MVTLLEQFVPETVLKRDEFSETQLGHHVDDPSRKLALRRLDGVPWYFRPLARWLARREARGLRAVQGIAGTPILLAADHTGILREWTEGLPLQLAKPDTAAFYKDAKALLRAMRRAGVSHNDLAKPQNWLMLPDGRAGVIDFQLAHVHRRRGLIARLAAREDLRHLIKQKRRYAPDLLTASEKRMLARKALPTRIWMATGKRLYNFITRRIMRWSDGEGQNHVLDLNNTDIAAAIVQDGATAAYVTTYPLPGGGTGRYAFVQGGQNGQPHPSVQLWQQVDALPRLANDAVWAEMLHLIANNRLDEIEALLPQDAVQKAQIRAIMNERLNFSDRHKV